MYNFAVIDEFGNADLDYTKDRVSSHFILTAVLFTEENKEYIEEQLEFIRKKYFQTGEMKSSGIGKNHRRRNIVLQNIIKLPIKIYCLVCNKSLLYSEGLSYRSVFYKYLHKQLYNDLFRYYPNIHVIADEIGDNNFMNEFKAYIEKNNPRELFENIYFEFKSSKEYLPIQCSDIIGGSIAWAYDSIYDPNNTNEFLTLLKNSDKIIHINHWPIEDIKKYPIFQTSEIDKNTESILVHVLTEILNFLKIQDEDELYIYRAKTLNYLLQEFVYGDSDRYVSADEILRHLNYMNENELNKTYFRTNIIASIRDYGIIIASSNSGYKIPSSLKDIMDYLDHNKSIIFPMIERIIKCHKAIRISTDGNLDIFEISQYKQLGDIANTFTGAKISQ